MVNKCMLRYVTTKKLISIYNSMKIGHTNLILINLKNIN